MSSPIAFDDTQFDLDLSDHLDQFPDGPAAAPAALAPFEAVVPVGDPWGVPADEVATADPVDRSEFEPEPESVATVEPPAVAVTAEDVPAPWVPEEGTAAAAGGWVDVPVAATVEDVPGPWAPAAGGTATWAAAVARAVDPPTQVHSVFAVTPPQGTPVVVVPPVPPAPPMAAAAAKAPTAARRRRRVVALLAAVLAAGLVAGGAGLAVATNGGGDDGEVAVADTPGQSVDLPPAGAEADKPDDDVAAPAAGSDVVPPAGDPAELDRAVDTVTTFLAVRGTDDERAVSSQGGRAEVDAAVAAIGRAVAQGDPTCSTGVDAGTFTCVLDTDKGPLTFTVGPDADDPQTSGFEVIGATVG